MSDITIRRPTAWSAAGGSDVGTVRKINEDAIVLRNDVNLWAIADGMGGHEAGDVASNMVVKSLELLDLSAELDEAINAVKECILDVNQRIMEYAEIMLEGRTFGTTIVSFVIKGQRGACVWAGDSRLYRYRNNQIEALSHDHSRVAELLKKGMLDSVSAATHPDSNIITRAVGVSEELNLDVNIFPVQMGDTFLLCSDGLYNSVTEEDMLQQLGSGSSQEAVQALITTALNNKANDNVSVIVVKSAFHSAADEEHEQVVI